VQLAGRQGDLRALRRHGLRLGHHLEGGVTPSLTEQQPGQRDQGVRILRSLRERVSVGLLGPRRATQDRERVAVDFLELGRGGAERHGLRQERLGLLSIAGAVQRGALT